MVTCPDCKGRGTSFAHINRGDKPHSFEEVNCLLCKGAGKMTAERYDRYLAGRLQRENRIAAGLGLREAALQRGITPSRLSAIERGEP